MLEALRDRLRSAIERIRGKAVVDKEAVEAFVKEVQRALLMADVDVEKVFEISRNIERRALEEEVPPGLTRKDQIVKIVYDELTVLLGGEKARMEVKKGKTTILMLVGIQGSGKTVSSSKLAYHLKQRGYRVGLMSTDTYRPAAQDQLRQLAERIDVSFYEAGSRSAEEIAVEGVHWFRDRGFDVVVLDTAGRHKEEKSLLQEMRRIAGSVKPDHIFLVLDGTIGQQARVQAQAFHEATPVGGIIVTKLDGTAKGGGALSAAAATGTRVFYIGAGEKVEDLEPYDPARFVGRLIGMGDVEALLEKVREMEDLQRMKVRMEKLAKGRFTLLDLMEQVEAVGKMGSLSKLLDLIPGLGMKVPKEAVKEAEEKTKKWRHIMKSMTDEEKIKPELVKAKRVRRISRGSGVGEKEVRDMIKQYFAAKKMMKSRQGRKLWKMMKKGGRLEDMIR